MIKAALILGCLLMLRGQVMQQAVVSTPPPVASGPNCSLCTFTQATNSGNTGVHTDPTSFVSATTAGHMLIVFGFHDHGSGTGTTHASNAPNAATWHPCNSGSSTADSPEIFISGTGSGAFYLSCNYAVNIPGASSDTVTIQSSDCVSVNCSVGGSYLEFAGISTTASVAFDGFQTVANATSTSGTNNTNCGTASTSQTNDLIICGTDQSTGSTSTAGTTPVTFTLRQPATNVGVESVVWTSTGSMTAAMTDSSSGDLYAGWEIFLK